MDQNLVDILITIFSTISYTDTNDKNPHLQHLLDFSITTFRTGTILFWITSNSHIKSKPLNRTNYTGTKSGPKSLKTHLTIPLKPSKINHTPMNPSKQMENNTQINYFNYITTDLTQTILSLLPLKSLIRCSTVCKQFRSITSNPTFHPTAQTTPWFFLYGLNNISYKKNQSFAYDPILNEWIHVPKTCFPDTLLAESSISGDKGLFFNTAGVNFSLSPILKPLWYATTPLKFSRFNPLIGVLKNGFCLDCGNKSGFGLDLDLELSVLRIIVVGGVRFIGGLVDMEDNLGVEIYNGGVNSWEICPPLPADFRSGNSSQSLCSGLFKERFYVFGIYSGFVSSFDLEKRVWSDVRTLRPPGVVMSCLISCGRELMLAGLCNDVRGHSFKLWRVDELTMEFSVVAIMPSDLLNCLFDSDGDDQFASLKCVGYGNFIFVFNEEHRRNYPACVCEIRPESGECRWRRVPDLPEPVNRFHKVIGFCSTIPIHRILGSEVV